MRYKQTYLMALSAILVIAFFVPWFAHNPDFQMFAQSDSAGLSGFSLIRGLSYAAPTLAALTEKAWVIYFGYAIVLIPIAGLAAIVLSGLRVSWASRIHIFQYAFTLLLFVGFFGFLWSQPDLSTLYHSVFITAKGVYINVLASVAGLGLILFGKKEIR
ncbi:MAG: hypothetical protein PWQ12_1633 [Clostridiales bacterium]|nr:hypothetical protein [Clostridiales bacterium]